MDHFATDFVTSKCSSCDEIALWHSWWGQIYPQTPQWIPLPNKDMFEEIINDYNEAASIIYLSPRWACALLRLALQKLMKQMGEEWKNIAIDLKSLADKEVLPRSMLQAIDITRYIWNESVHPWELNMNDRSELAIQLFVLINRIAEYWISWPIELQNLHDLIPENKKQV